MLVCLHLSDAFFPDLFMQSEQMVTGRIMQWHGDPSWNPSWEGCVAGDVAAAHCLTAGNT